jgi:hypothetical protein
MDQSMGHKIDKDVGHSLVQIRSAKRKAPLKEVKRGRTALSLNGIMIIAKDANLLKMLILN